MSSGLGLAPVSSLFHLRVSFSNFRVEAGYNENFLIKNFLALVNFFISRFNCNVFSDVQKFTEAPLLPFYCEWILQGAMIIQQEMSIISEVSPSTISTVIIVKWQRFICATV